MARFDIKDIQELLAAFTGAKAQGEKFAITNKSLQDLGDQAADYLNDHPNDIEDMIQRAQAARQRLLTDASIGAIVTLQGRPMKVVRESDAMTLIKDCFEGPPKP